MAAAGGARVAFSAGAATRPFLYSAAGSTQAAPTVLRPAARAAAKRMAAAIPRCPVPAARASSNYSHPAAADFLSETAAVITRPSLLPSPPPPTRARAIFSPLDRAAAAPAAAAAECYVASSYSAAAAVHVPLALSSAAACGAAAAAATTFDIRLASLSFPCATSSKTATAATRAAGAAFSHVLPPDTQYINAFFLPWAFESSRFSSNIVQRAVRELPWGSREDLLRDRSAPVYVHEKRGTTPRREYNVNLLDGIRVRPTVNPFVKLNKAKRYVLDNWPSRNWEDWTPYRCYVRGSRRRYNIPQDLFPYKDELGEWHPPRLSARYKADVKKQYIMNDLPWVWEKDFYEGKLHFADRELLGPKRWYRRAFRRERVKEALRKMDDLVLNYRQEVRDRKKYDWFEKAVYDFAGEEIATQFIRKRVEPNF